MHLLVLGALLLVLDLSDVTKVEARKCKLLIQESDESSKEEEFAEIWENIKPEAEKEWQNIEIIESERSNSDRRKREVGLLKSEAERKEILKKSISEVNKDNKRPNATWCGGANYIETLDNDEFEEGLLGVSSLDFSNITETAGINGPVVQLKRRGIGKREDVVDHREHTGEVEMQDCNNCWVFASSHTLVGMYSMAYGNKFDGSEEQLTYCSYEGRTKCKNGHTFEAYNFASKHPFVSEKRYKPKKSKGFWARLFGTLKKQKKGCDKARFRAAGRPMVNGWKWVDGHGVHAMNKPGNKSRAEAMREVVYHQPVTVYMQVSKGGFKSYENGVWDYDGDDCKSINHSLVVVGYGTDKEAGDYWILKNSWGKSFGDKGYIKVKAGKNLCNVEALGHYPVAVDGKLLGH